MARTRPMIRLYILIGGVPVKIGNNMDALSLARAKVGDPRWPNTGFGTDFAAISVGHMSQEVIVVK